MPTCNDEPIPQPIRNKLLVEAKHRCCICYEMIVDIHHIIWRMEGGSNDESNLIVLCPNCHRRVEMQKITPTQLRMYKRMWLKRCKDIPGIKPLQKRPIFEIVSEFIQRWDSLIGMYEEYKKAVSNSKVSNNKLELIEAQYKEHRDFFLKAFPKFKDSLASFRLRIVSQPIGNKYDVFNDSDLRGLQENINPFEYFYYHRTLNEQLKALLALSERYNDNYIQKRILEAERILKSYLGHLENE